MATNKNRKILSKEAKIFVVSQLAMWELPSIIRDDLKEQFGFEITVQAIVQYDPTRVPKVAPQWEKLFKEIREDFLSNTAKIAIANKAFRLRELNAHYENLKRLPARLKNTAEMRATLKQAAEDAGDAYTNRRQLTGKDGEKLIPENTGPQVVVYIPDNQRGDAMEAVSLDNAGDTPNSEDNAINEA